MQCHNVLLLIVIFYYATVFSITSLFNLDIKQRGSIFHLVLHNDTNSLEADLVLLNSMTELLGKTLEVLDLTIEGLMASPSMTLEPS